MKKTLKQGLLNLSILTIWNSSYQNCSLNSLDYYYLKPIGEIGSNNNLKLAN
jgi:hypothetical protein